MKNISMMANWIGGAFIHRDKKGDPNARPPIEVVSAKTQREALKFVLESTFRDEAYALTPELLSRLTKDFMDQGFSSMSGEPTWPVHDRILATQSATLTSLLNATTLRRVYDNEFRVEADEDAFTLPELLDGVRDEIWSELELKADKQYTARQPMISSLRRNLQREHMERMIDLTLPNNGSSAAYKAISNLAVKQLRDLKEKIDQALKTNAKSMDPYTEAHLSEAAHRIEKALDADYVYNQSSGLAGDFLFLFHQEGAEQAGGQQQPPRPAEQPYPATPYPSQPQPVETPRPVEAPRPADAPGQP
jgi:hypothetical protein